MAFPTGWNTAIYDRFVFTNATETNYVHTHYILSATLMAACRSDGGDLRATLDDGTTQVPIEVVDFNQVSGYCKVLIGPLPNGTTAIRIYANGTDTADAAGATYGKNAVWANHSLSAHLQEIPSTVPTNSGATAYTITLGSGMTTIDSITGVFGQNGSGRALNFDGTTNDVVNIATNAGLDVGTGSFVLSCWVRLANSAVAGVILGCRTNSGAFEQYTLWQCGGFSGGSPSTGKRIGIIKLDVFGSNDSFRYTSTDVADGNWHHLALAVTNGSVNPVLYVDGTAATLSTDQQNGNGAYSNSDNSQPFRIGDGNGAQALACDVEEVRLMKATPFSATWYLREYQNTNDFAGFGTTTYTAPSGHVFPLAGPGGGLAGSRRGLAA